MYSGQVDIRERGGCLSVYLTVVICSSSFVMFYTLANPGWLGPFMVSGVISPLLSRSCLQMSFAPARFGIGNSGAFMVCMD
jgi:hypothetical protein